jgi:peptidoglycan/xylan/chitin deacetylase (PgdA/CDA1 family)
MRIPGFKTVRQSARWLRSRFLCGGLILGYHRIASITHDPHQICIDPANFAEQLEALRRYAHPLSLQEVVQGLHHGTLPRRAIALTFDDGYADVLYHALPLLEQFEIPATLFVVTGRLGETFRWDKAEPEATAPNHDEPSCRRAVTKDELRQLAGSPLVELGAHSVTHPMLATCPAAEQQVEIQQSKVHLQELLGRPVTGFSYPHGSVSSLTRELVRASGYKYACASFNDVARRNSDPFCLPRFWVPNWNGARFGRWLRWWLPG